MCIKFLDIILRVIIVMIKISIPTESVRGLNPNAAPCLIKITIMMGTMMNIEDNQPQIALYVRCL
jgi:hypothetical protein